MNKHFKIMAFALALFSLTSCSDFFTPSADDQLDGEDYISSNTEMYTGFLGIMTKLQAVGDKEIFITDTRADLLEPTEQSTADLIALYNYDTDLQNNSYANPAGYYEVIITCNDYIEKMKSYRNEPQADDDVCKALMSSALRIKVWAYKTLGEIYGEAVWFDDPIEKISVLNDAEKFTKMDLAALVDKCISTLDNGVDDVNSKLTIDWISWLDPDNISSIAKSEYRKWNSMIPPYEGLYGELCLWKGAIADAQGVHETQWYQQAADVLLSGLNAVINTNEDHGSSPYWLPTAATPGRWGNYYWDNSQPDPNECVAAIIYDYTNNQTNTLLKHFSTEYPNEYLLRPSDYGINHRKDATFNPGNLDGSETRSKNTFGSTTEGNYIAKFRPIGSTARAQPYQDDVHIYLYRATQYHLMLAEALNNLNRWNAMDAVLNTGVTTAVYKANDPEWEGFNANWTSSTEWGTQKYPHAGLRGAYKLTSRDVKTSIVGTNAETVRRYNDEAILDEIMIEFACEGKVYPAMNRIALRYNDLDIIADRVCPKYEESGKNAKVRASIESGGNYVHYDLNFN